MHLGNRTIRIFERSWCSYPCCPQRESYPQGMGLRLGIASSIPVQSPSGVELSGRAAPDNGTPLPPLSKFMVIQTYRLAQVTSEVQTALNVHDEWLLTHRVDLHNALRVTAAKGFNGKRVNIQLSSRVKSVVRTNPNLRNFSYKLTGPGC